MLRPPAARPDLFTVWPFMKKVAIPGKASTTHTFFSKEEAFSYPVYLLVLGNLFIFMCLHSVKRHMTHRKQAKLRRPWRSAPCVLPAPTGSALGSREYEDDVTDLLLGKINVLSSSGSVNGFVLFPLLFQWASTSKSHLCSYGSGCGAACVQLGKSVLCTELAEL